MDTHPSFCPFMILSALPPKIGVAKVSVPSAFQEWCGGPGSGAAAPPHAGEAEQEQECGRGFWDAENQ